MARGHPGQGMQGKLPGANGAKADGIFNQGASPYSRPGMMGKDANGKDNKS